MNEDCRKVNNDAASAQQQQQRQDEPMTSTRLTPFSIDNILSRSRDFLAPASQPLVVSSRSSGGLTGNSKPTADQSGYVDTTRVVLTTSRHLQAPVNVTSSTGEIITSSNLDELQTLLNSKLRQQHHQTPLLPTPPPPPPPPHHHYHGHHSSQLSQQQTGAMPASFYAQFHRHLSTLPTSIDGTYYYVQGGPKNRTVFRSS